MSCNRRTFLLGSAASAASLLIGRRTSAADPELIWHDVTTWGVEGRGWETLERKRYFDRLPAKAEGVVRPPVWELSRHSAGMAVRFQTNAKVIHADYELLSASLDMPHMPATGVSGLDLYGELSPRDERWVQVIMPSAQHIKQAIVSGLDGAIRNYTIYLPLYNGVNSLKIGVPGDCEFHPIAPRTDKALVFYGTSIMHGGCASRPGMAIPAILGRVFDRPTINLGFSGNGTMDPEFVDLMAELDPAVYCIDCLPNMSPDAVRQRAKPLVEKLRATRTDTPILLVEDRVFTNAPFLPERQQFHKDNHRALREVFDSLIAAGVPHLHYLPGDDLLGSDGEGAVDGSHPSDLGFLRNAQAYETVLRPILDCHSSTSHTRARSAGSRRSMACRKAQL
ncbi:MAG: SGNH/GDSL hydrolase family protein [Pirellulaceae bacterium]